MSGARQDFQRREAEARKSLERDLGLTWAHLNLGTALMEESRLDASPDPARTREALSHYEELLSLKEAQGAKASDSDYSAGVVNLCDGLIQSRDLSRALEICLKATQLLPDQADVFYNFAGVYALSGQSDLALKALEKDFSLGDRDAEYLSSDAWFESLHGNPGFQSLLHRMRGHPASGPR